MREMGVPVLPGSAGVLKSPEEALEMAEEIGYPVILKASAGGGGRGMRVVNQAEELARSSRRRSRKPARRSVRADVYLEKYIGAPRHIEFQMLADEHGNVEILGERECSIQRRHQKLLEESPSPARHRRPARGDCRTALRKAMTAAGYTNAGTVEFLMDENGKLYFIEVNARIQVEHPVTEMVTGIDIVKSQIRIAQGETLQDILRGPGRPCAAMPSSAASMPRIPKRSCLRPAASPASICPAASACAWIRWAYTDCVIPPYYDSLVAKLIAYGARPHGSHPAHAARAGMFVVEGIHTSIPLHQQIMADPDFQAGKFDTNFIKRFMPAPKN